MPGLHLQLLLLLLVLYSRDALRIATNGVTVVCSQRSRIRELHEAEAHLHFKVMGVRFEQLDAGVYQLQECTCDTGFSSAICRMTCLSGYAPALTPFCRTPEALIEAVGELQLIADDWILHTECISPYCNASSSKGLNVPELSPPRSVSSRMLLCALAQRISGKPRLRTDSIQYDDRGQYTVLECSGGFMLLQGRLIPPPKNKLVSRLTATWKKRPFIFSGALNVEAGTSLLSIIRSLHRLYSSTEEYPLSLLDPTCGSGTTAFLCCLLNMQQQLAGRSVAVGTVLCCDINEAFIRGCRKNWHFARQEMHSICEEMRVNNSTAIAPSGAFAVCDASDSSSDLHFDAHSSNDAWCDFAADLVISNMPWDENKSQKYFGDREAIIRRLGADCNNRSYRIADGAIIAVITTRATTVSAEVFRESGLQLLQLDEVFSATSKGNELVLSRAGGRTVTSNDRDVIVTLCRRAQSVAELKLSD